MFTSSSVQSNFFRNQIEKCNIKVTLDLCGKLLYRSVSRVKMWKSMFIKRTIKILANEFNEYFASVGKIVADNVLYIDISKS